MAISIGIVCEGSHDFNVLSIFIEQMCEEYFIDVLAIDCLQPQVAATFQTSGGGWTQVKSWCEENGGEGYRKYIDRPFFGTSKLYDLIIVHLDGDVVDHCHAAPLTELSLSSLEVSAAIEVLKDAILNKWLTVEPSHTNRLLACIPVQHLEAWLTAGLDSEARQTEIAPTKDTFRRGPIRRGKASWRTKYIRAARAAVKNLSHVRETCVSYSQFEEDFLHSSQAI